MNSNVSSVVAMTDMIELEKSATMTSYFQASVYDLEKTALEKLSGKN